MWRTDRVKNANLVTSALDTILASDNGLPTEELFHDLVTGLFNCWMHIHCLVCDANLLHHLGYL